MCIYRNTSVCCGYVCSGNRSPKISNVGHRRKVACPKEVRKCSIRKRSLWKQLQVSPHDSLLRNKYRECVFKWRELVRHGEILTEQRLVTSCDLGAFYRHVNRKMAKRSLIGAITANDGRLLVADVKKANAFNDYFASVGITDDGSVPLCDSVCFPDSLDCLTISELDVMSAIDHLKCKYSCGPDGLPPALFKHLKVSLSTPLALVFNQLLSVGEVPEVWKKAIVIPVHKKGPTGTMSNYRPISLTCVLSKIMESIISRKIYTFLSDHGVLHRSQHGFMQKRSVCTNLLQSFNDWTIYVQARDQTTVIYIDFKKAFDVVSHEKLFIRLQSYNITGVVLLWLKNFFCSFTTYKSWILFVRCFSVIKRCHTGVVLAR